MLAYDACGNLVEVAPPPKQKVKWTEEEAGGVSDVGDQPGEGSRSGEGGYAEADAMMQNFLRHLFTMTLKKRNFPTSRKRYRITTFLQ